MTPEPASPRGSDYAALSRQVRQSGLLDRRPRYYAWKISLTAAALALGWAAFAAIGNSWWQLADAVFLVQQGLLGFYLGCSFAPNHKGMPILTASDKTDFLRRQVLTSRNVRGDWLTDFALGVSWPARPRPRRLRCPCSADRAAQLQPGSGPAPASPASWPPRRASRSPMAIYLSADSGTGRCVSTR
jgi:hypothetical protein